MDNNLTDRDYINLIIDFINKQKVSFISKKYSEKDIVSHCVSNTHLLDSGDIDRIYNLVRKTISYLNQNNSVFCSNKQYKTRNKFDANNNKIEEILQFEQEQTSDLPNEEIEMI